MVQGISYLKKINPELKNLFSYSTRFVQSHKVSFGENENFCAFPTQPKNVYKKGQIVYNWVKFTHFKNQLNIVNACFSRIFKLVSMLTYP